MSDKKKIQFLRCTLLPLVGALVMGMSAGAVAQWKWVDSSGTTHYTDAPPPKSVPEHNILSRPAGGSGIYTGPVTAPKPPAKPNDQAQDRATRRLEETRKEQEEEAARQKAAQEAASRAERAKACEEARKVITALDSGVRLGGVDDKGERYYLDDAQRAQRRTQAQQRINEYCK